MGHLNGAVSAENTTRIRTLQVDTAERATPELPLADLASHPIWVAWVEEQRTRKDGTTKATKVPYAARGLGHAKADEPGTWGTRAEAEARAQGLLRGGRNGGIGLMLGPLPDESGLILFGIDLDSCIDPGGPRWKDAITASIAPWAGEIIELFQTYSEISPSGRGVKIFGLCRAKDMPAVLGAFGKGPKGAQRIGFKRTLAAGEHGPAIECYFGKRYFTVTGEWLVEGRPGLRVFEADTIAGFISQHDGTATCANAPGSRTGENRGARRDADAVQDAVGQAKIRSNPGNKVRDESRSGDAARLAVRMKRQGATFEEFRAEVTTHRLTADWAAERGEREVERAWQRLGNLQAGKSGNPISNLRNTLCMLRSDPRLSGIIRFDEMEGVVMLMQHVPSYNGSTDPADFTPRRFADDDNTAIVEYLQAAGLTSLNATVAHAAVDLRAKECAFHPVREYLDGLVWDGVPRLDSWLAAYLGATATEYIRRVGRMFIVAMVARVRRPGCKVDYMLVLEGAQGAGKSAACRILGGPWFSDALPDLHRDDVRVSQHLRGKWVVEVAELSAMNKAESSALKAFITRPIEAFTPKYGRRDVAEPRQCVFIGTTNPDGSGYLKDATGARRFWPVRVGPAADLEGLARDRDQLFAEASRAFDLEENWWPDRAFEAEHAAPEQEARYEGDAWDEPIGRYLVGEGSGLFPDARDEQTGRRPRERVTVAEVARGALGMAAERIIPQTQQRIAKCLARAGWVSRHGGHVRWWEPGPARKADA